MASETKTAEEQIAASKVIIADLVATLKQAEVFVEFLDTHGRGPLGGLVLVGSATPTKCLANIRSAIAKASA